VRYSIRLLPRERIALLNMRLDPLLTTRTFADVAGVSELLEGMIFFTEHELRHGIEIKQEIRKYFAYKKNMPLTQMGIKESAPGEILSIDEIEQIGSQEISGKEIIEDLLPPYNPVDMNSHTTGWLNPLIDKKAEEILLNLFQDINEVKISDGELLKGLIHFFNTVLDTLTMQLEEEVGEQKLPKINMYCQRGWGILGRKCYKPPNAISMLGEATLTWSYK
jgi:hypothetical protein